MILKEQIIHQCTMMDILLQRIHVCWGLGIEKERGLSGGEKKKCK
jgi:hypothetical protein